MIKVDKPNMAQKGTVSIEKTGEVFSGVNISGVENADFLKNEYGWGGSYPVIIGAGIDEQHDGKGITISKGIGSDKPHKMCIRDR